MYIVYKETKIKIGLTSILDFGIKMGHLLHFVPNQHSSHNLYIKIAYPKF